VPAAAAAAAARRGEYDEPEEATTDALDANEPDPAAAGTADDA